MADRQSLAVGHAGQLNYYVTLPQIPGQSTADVASAVPAASRGRWLDEVCAKVRHYWVDEAGSARWSAPYSSN